MTESAGVAFCATKTVASQAVVAGVLLASPEYSLVTRHVPTLSGTKFVVTGSDPATGSVSAATRSVHDGSSGPNSRTVRVPVGDDPSTVAPAVTACPTVGLAGET